MESYRTFRQLNKQTNFKCKTKIDLFQLNANISMLGPIYKNQKNSLETSNSAKTSGTNSKLYKIKGGSELQASLVYGKCL